VKVPLLIFLLEKVIKLVAMSFIDATKQGNFRLVAGINYPDLVSKIFHSG
jgi:hypothetical protein